MNINVPKRVVIELGPNQLPLFFPQFQKGVTIPANVGCSLKSLLCDQLSIPEGYVTDRITTIFCDNHPVDDLDRTIIKNGSRIGLSAAMPGLVGATMRRGGFYAALRQGISQKLSEGNTLLEKGTVTAKLFNLLLQELGPTLLANGIILDKNEFVEVMQILSVPYQAVDISDRTLLVVTFRDH